MVDAYRLASFRRSRSQSDDPGDIAARDWVKETG